MNDMAAQAIAQIECDRVSLIGMSCEIHDHPELAYQESRAASLLKTALASRGFEVANDPGGLPTAFDAQLKGSGAGPTIALLAEYDALPVIGHGCGHNLIGAGVTGAAMGLAPIMPRIAGTLRVIGTPAEEFTEGKQGKIKLLERGVFEGVDVCLMFHPWTASAIPRADFGFVVTDIVFRGRSAHAAADPWRGLNALDAAMLTYAGLSALRQQLRAESRLHCILTRGGDAVNVIPDLTSLRVMVRSSEARYLDDMVAKLENCARGSALATGTDVTLQEVSRVQPSRFNEALCRIVGRNLALLGEPAEEMQFFNASSDFGNVSQTLPALSVLVRTHSAGTNWHSEAAAAGAITEAAHSGMILAAKALAMSALDLFLDSELLEAVESDFSRP